MTDGYEMSSDLEDLEDQKKVINELLKKPLADGDKWFLLDTKWFKQWKKYVGFDQWGSDNVGDKDAHPGPIDNTPLLKESSSELQGHLIDQLDYTLLPQDAWDKMLAWYGMSNGQEPIARNVIKQGIFVKHCKVEVYLMDIKLCENSNMEEPVIKLFSRADTVEDVERVMRREFGIPDDTEVRLWNKYMSNTYEHLSKQCTLQDAGMYPGQVIVIEQKNDDGTWPNPRQTKTKPSTAVAQAVPDLDKWPLCELDESHGKSLWKCLHCGDYMCASCTNIHRKGKKSRHHRLLHKDRKSDEEKVMKELFCSVHNGVELDRYCRDEKKAICVECFVKSHTDHDVITMDALADENRSRVGKILATADQGIPKYASLIKKIDKHIEEAEKRNKKNCHIIDSVTERVINKIREKSTSMKEMKEKDLKALKKTLEMKKDDIQKTKQRMEKETLASRRFLETCNNRALIDEASQYIKRLNFKQPEEVDVALENLGSELDPCEVEKCLYKD